MTDSAKLHAMMDHLGKEAEDTCHRLRRLNAALERSNAALRSLAETIKRQKARCRGSK
jgi:hypothetical protein